MSENIGPEGPSRSARSRQLTLRLVAARIGAGRATPAVYFDEFNAVMREVAGDAETFGHMINELTEIAWSLLCFVLEPEDEGIDLAWFREQDEATIMALVENWLDRPERHS
ncbi:MAG: hypothetical protein AABM30_11710 [Actinomycetota bacterium]